MLVPERSCQLQDVCVLDYEQRSSRIATEIKVHDGKFHSVRWSAEVRDVAATPPLGGYLAPALFDAHTHINHPTELGAYLRFGVGGIRDMAGSWFTVSLKAQVEAGTRLGPSILTATPVFDRVSTSAPRAQFAVDLNLVLRDFDTKQLGEVLRPFDQIKLYDGLDREQVRCLRLIADHLGKPIVGHPSAHLGYLGSVDAGYLTVEHLSRFLRGRRGAIQQRIASWADDVDRYPNVGHCATLSVADGLARVSSQSALDRSEVSPFAELWSGSLRSNDRANQARRLLQVQMLGMRALSERNCSILLGSDAPNVGVRHGEGLIRELELTSLSTGWTVEQVLAANAKNVRALFGVGTDPIGAGSECQHVLYVSDPRASIETLKKPKAVLVPGGIVRESSLNKCWNEYTASRQDPEITTQW